MKILIQSWGEFSSTKGHPVVIHFRRILVTTDLSSHSLSAFEHAFSLQMLYGSRVYVLYVADSSFPFYARNRLEGIGDLNGVDVEKVNTKSLHRFITDHFDAEKKSVAVVRSGSAEAEILRFAEEEKIDLIVMATHGWTGLKHILMGSVTEKVVRRSPVPVLTVKPKSIGENLLTQEDIDVNLHLKPRSGKVRMP